MKRGQYVHWVKEIRHLFWTATGFFLIHALSYLLMPISTEVSESKNSRLALLITGCTFWISLLVGYTLVVWANAERKAFIKNRLDGDISMHCRMGVITFFANTPAIIVDASLFAGIIALVIIYCIGATNNDITYVMLAIVSFSLNMHSLFNGRIYRITKYKRTRRDENHE